MKHLFPFRHAAAIVCSALVLCIAQSARADSCYVDYKAKRDTPLRLHYGVMQLTKGCSSSSAQQEAAQRLQSAGWTLLSIQTVFGPDGLDQRKADAGSYYLRF